MALPKVPVMMSIRPITPQYSAVPRPCSPIKPTAWLSSTMVSASNSSARSQMPLRFAIYPSIENTPSVAMRIFLQPKARASSSFARRSSMLLFL